MACRELDIRGRLAAAWIQRAVAAGGVGNEYASVRKKRERIAKEILKTDPRHARALHVLGCALLMQGRAQDAVAPLEAAARGRHDPEIETQLAMALIQIGRRDDALSRLKRAAKRQPPYAPAFHGLGHCCSPWSATTKRSRCCAAASKSRR